MLEIHLVSAPCSNTFTLLINMYCPEKPSLSHKNSDNMNSIVFIFQEVIVLSK